MKPSELKKATSARLNMILDAITHLQSVMNLTPGISWNDRRTLELWEEQVKKAKDLHFVYYGKQIYDEV